MDGGTYFEVPLLPEVPDPDEPEVPLPPAPEVPVPELPEPEVLEPDVPVPDPDVPDAPLPEVPPSDEPEPLCAELIFMNSSRLSLPSRSVSNCWNIAALPAPLLPAP